MFMQIVDARIERETRRARRRARRYSRNIRCAARSRIAKLRGDTQVQRLYGRAWHYGQLASWVDIP